MKICPGCLKEWNDCVCRVEDVQPSIKRQITTFEQNLERAKTMPQFFLGQQIITKEGRGIIVKLEMPANGLYIEPERTQIVVWYGCGNDSLRWSQLTYSIIELQEEITSVMNSK